MVKIFFICKGMRDVVNEDIGALAGSGTGSHQALKGKIWKILKQFHSTVMNGERQQQTQSSE